MYLQQRQELKPGLMVRVGRGEAWLGDWRQITGKAKWSGRSPATPETSSYQGLELPDRIRYQW